MEKFKSKDELIERVFWLHCQNLNGRENAEEAFKKGIEATLEELEKLNGRILEMKEPPVPKIEAGPAPKKIIKWKKQNI